MNSLPRPVLSLYIIHVHIHLIFYLMLSTSKTPPNKTAPAKTSIIVAFSCSVLSLYLIHVLMYIKINSTHLIRYLNSSCIYHPNPSFFVCTFTNIICTLSLSAMCQCALQTALTQKNPLFSTQSFMHCSVALNISHCSIQLCSYTFPIVIIFILSYNWTDALTFLSYIIIIHAASHNNDQQHNTIQLSAF